MHNANGNMTRDANKRIGVIKYNLLNLPDQVVGDKLYTSSIPVGPPARFNRESSTYVYDALGRKLSVFYVTERGETVPGLGVSPVREIVTSFPESKLDFCGNFIYENDTLSKVLTPEGYFSVSGLLTMYTYLRDHQGNVRVVLNQRGSIRQVNHYYPFGGLMDLSSNGQLHRWKYGGKELDLWAK